MTLLAEPRYLTLHKLFTGRLFRIPEYQRAYSWHSKQRRDLFDDIRLIQKRNLEFHFMATIVGHRRTKKTILTNEFDVVDIVDGQQRITTLVLLYRAIAKRLVGASMEEKAVRNELDSLLIKKDELSMLLLRTNHDHHGFYSDYLRKGTIPEMTEAETLADRALISAINECERFANKWEDLLELSGILKNRLTFVLHEVGDESVVYTVFEVLNSRGLAVAWIDRLKSILMEIAFKSGTGNEQGHIDELHNIWRDIYRQIGIAIKLSSESLRFAATLKAEDQKSKMLGEEAAVQEVRNIVGNNVAKAVEFSKWLKLVASVVDEIDSDFRRAAVNKIRHARFLNAAIRLANFSNDDRELLLDQWERSTVRIFGLSRRDARTGVGDYVRLGYRIINNNLDYATTLQELKKLAEGEFSIEHAVKSLGDEEINWYKGWSDEVRYLLFRWEEHLAREAGEDIADETWHKIWSKGASKSIEHIMPQSKGADEPTEDGIYIHRLGNLTVLPPSVNSRLGNLLPAEKANTYSDEPLRVTRRLESRLENWDRDAVSAREKEIIEWAREEWDDISS